MEKKLPLLCKKIGVYQKRGKRIARNNKYSK
jgi:hypothetical protein